MVTHPTLASHSLVSSSFTVTLTGIFPLYATLAILIPHFYCQRRTAAAFPQPLRVAHSFVAVLAYADKVALLIAVCIRVPDIQRQLGSTAHMVDMVHKLRPPVTPALLAQLALMLVHVQHLVR